MTTRAAFSFEASQLCCPFRAQFYALAAVRSQDESCPFVCRAMVDTTNGSVQAAIVFAVMELVPPGTFRRSSLSVAITGGIGGWNFYFADSFWHQASRQECSMPMRRATCGTEVRVSCTKTTVRPRGRWRDECANLRRRAVPHSRPRLDAPLKRGGAVRRGRYPWQRSVEMQEAGRATETVTETPQNRSHPKLLESIGAGDGIRTRDQELGKLPDRSGQSALRRSLSHSPCDRYRQSLMAYGCCGDFSMASLVYGQE
jgi:hypothetical protein